MAIMITDECINCGACEPECPNNAIYEGGAEWKYSDGTSLKGIIKTSKKFISSILKSNSGNHDSILTY